MLDPTLFPFINDLTFYSRVLLTLEETFHFHPVVSLFACKTFHLYTPITFNSLTFMLYATPTNYIDSTIQYYSIVKQCSKKLYTHNIPETKPHYHFI